MGLIFSSLKTHFLMLCFAHFSLTLKHTDFHFSFDTLAQIMKFSAFIFGDCMTGNLAMETMTTSEKANCDYLENFVINDLV